MRFPEPRGRFRIGRTESAVPSDRIVEPAIALSTVQVAVENAAARIVWLAEGLFST